MHRSKPKQEIRSYTSIAPSLEVRAGSNGKTVKGTAIVYNSLSPDNNMGFKEKIDPNAFVDSLKTNSDLRLLLNHDTTKVLGRTSSGTLQIKNTPKGLTFSCELGQSSQAIDTIDMLERGDVTGCSFGLFITDETWEKDEDGTIVRTITKGQVFELSVCSFPYYPQTDASVRSIPDSCPAEFRSQIRDASDDTSDDDTPCDCEDEDCDDEDCEDRSQSCPGEDEDDYDESDPCHDEQDDEERSDQLRIRKLFHNRLTANSLN
jgi:HK97 family phage prohead protease